MAYFVLEYQLVDDYIERRAALRSEHLELASAAADRGELVLAGALAEPPDRAVLVWNVEDASAVEGFANADPYVRNGLVTAWSVRPWSVVTGAGYAG
jgi:uncharacterized protein YciI